MVNNTQPQEQRAYVVWDARRFQNVRNLSDYLRVKARTPSSGTRKLTKVLNGGVIRWWRQLALANKIGMVAVAVTAIGVIVGAISLVIHW